MLHSDKARFRLEMTINQLSNIPQLSGKCGLELRIGDKRGFSLTRNKTTVNSDLSNGNGPSATISSSSSPSGVSVSTGLRKIHNFKCAFNCKVTCNLKFPVKKSENLIGSKHAYFTVYTRTSPVPNSKQSELLMLRSSQSYNHLHYDTLGKVDINLSEYLNFREPKTSKYLLRDSKVNSILSVTVLLKEIPPDVEFHTNLQVEDLSNLTGSPTTATTTTTTTSSSLGAKKALASPTFNVPVFERKNVFSGFNEVLTGGGDTHSSQSGGNGTTHSDGSVQKNTTKTTTAAPVSAANNSIEQPLIMDTLVSTLYKRVLESTWDPELHTLLNYPPEQCINDIFESPDSFKEGWNERLSQKFGVKPGDNDDEDDSHRNLNGLINEISYREDLKSWG
ncbi:uncharacterized protein KQ657_002740 [Scheffersomyces spartinae]|uniref:C2 NT-type domain-containing protein n=1 Tax=Scheffersomyces spartinae TaxID=45513 RepID=A0A9P7V5X9_9ASCO|nr:uncharacterized protein KQ657_002740 [Scheffersomyces spartinae]KAG7191775.1 hypothetical protein KQ657_002740 [Scheffersomyces spartinae]